MFLVCDHIDCINVRLVIFSKTGGPDGDVAGNEIKILIREYGNKAKIVGISDVSGCAEDPKGLDHDEVSSLNRTLMSLFKY